MRKIIIINIFLLDFREDHQSTSKINYIEIRLFKLRVKKCPNRKRIIYLKHWLFFCSSFEGEALGCCLITIVFLGQPMKATGNAVLIGATAEDLELKV
jgi:hypothetical protein